MKKYVLLLSFAIGALLMTTNAYTQKKATTTKKQTANAPMTKDNANKIITMTNCAVDIYNEQIREIEDVADCINRFEKSIQAVSENPKRTAHSGACSNIRPLRKDLMEKLEVAAKSAPAFTEKAAILEGMQKVNKEFELAITRCENVQEYFSKKEYLQDDDEYSKYVSVRDTLIASYKNIKQIFDQTMELSSEAGDRAEVVILKTSPIASVVVPMKNNLSAVSRLMAKCGNDNPSTEAITAEIAAIRKMLEKDKIATPAIKTALKKIHNGDSYFERFYKYEEEALAETLIFLEFLNPDKKIDNVDHVLKETEEQARTRNLDKYYNKIRDQYRYMVDVYNNI